MGRVGGRGVAALAGEAFMVVFAVLVALAVDEWREDREVEARVERAEAAIQTELRSNQAELREGRASVLAMYQAVTESLVRVRNGEVVDSANLSGEIPDFADAAWETARVTGAIAHMPYDQVLEWSRVYRTQALADEGQGQILAAVGGLVARGFTPETLMELQAALFIALQVYDNLEESYARMVPGEAP